MKLGQLVSALPSYEALGVLDPMLDISTITEDSRKAIAKSIFVALKGEETDGHRYIDAAIAQGAVVVVLEKAPSELKEGIAYLLVEDTHQALALLAEAYYRNPSRALKLVGVTGTNGKTTIATLLYELYRMAGYKVGLISTIKNRINDKEYASTHTTPMPMELAKLIREMVDEGCQYAFMEVSSHAVAQKRILGLEFDGAIFTNLTQDHLDYHETMAQYLAAKKQFFDLLDPSAFALVNMDDRNGRVMVQNTRAHVSGYALKSLTDFHGRVLERHLDGTLLEINGHSTELRLVGEFNMYNMLAIFGAATLLGMPKEQSLVLMSRLLPVRGRFETLRSPLGTLAIVDYAHTPDALENVLKTIRPLMPADAKLCTVVGCGGNRDKTKRPIMARVAYELSDQLILTSDNPRREDPEAILADMLSGLTELEQQTTLVIPHREEAIGRAVSLAQPQDVILVAGKGHETYQEIDGVRHHFDDKEVLERAFLLER